MPDTSPPNEITDAQLLGWYDWITSSPLSPSGLDKSDCLRLITEVRRLRAERAWRPIETAPRDGTEIWLFWAGDRRLAKWIETDGPFGEFVGWMPQDRNAILINYKPTHWMPLPEPPDA